MSSLDRPASLYNLKVEWTKESGYWFMKNTVFVRPNLKMILLGAIALVVAQHLITDGLSQATAVLKPAVASARELKEDELQKVIERASAEPSVEAYAYISRCYELRGEYKKALLYLRRAGLLSQTLDLVD